MRQRIETVIGVLAGVLMGAAVGAWVTTLTTSTGVLGKNGQVAIQPAPLFWHAVLSCFFIGLLLLAVLIGMGVSEWIFHRKPAVIIDDGVPYEHGSPETGFEYGFKLCIRNTRPQAITGVHARLRRVRPAFRPDKSYEYSSLYFTERITGRDLRPGDVKEVDFVGKSATGDLTSGFWMNVDGDHTYYHRGPADIDVEVIASDKATGREAPLYSRSVHLEVGDHTIESEFGKVEYVPRVGKFLIRHGPLTSEDKTDA